jgi:hypothetical protein
MRSILADDEGVAEYYIVEYRFYVMGLVRNQERSHESNKHTEEIRIQ